MMKWLYRFFNERWAHRLFQQACFEAIFGREVMKIGRRKIKRRSF